MWMPAAPDGPGWDIYHSNLSQTQDYACLSSDVFFTQPIVPLTALEMAHSEQAVSHN